MENINTLVPIVLEKSKKTFYIRVYICDMKIAVTRKFSYMTKHKVLEQMKLYQSQIYELIKPILFLETNENIPNKLEQQILIAEFYEKCETFYINTNGRPFHIVCQNKLDSVIYKDYDCHYEKMHGFKVNMDWLLKTLKQQNYMCCYCNKKLALSHFYKNDPDQFVINRKNTRFGHYESNCNIICLSCNSKYDRKTY